MISPVKVRSAIVVAFNVSEHCCAVGYALTEFAIAHSHLFLNVFSAVLLAALIGLAFLKLHDHWLKLHDGYRAL